MFRCLLSDFFVHSARNSCNSCVSPVGNEPCYLVAPGFFVFLCLFGKRTPVFGLRISYNYTLMEPIQKNSYSTQVEYIAPVLSLRSIIQQALIKFSVYTNTAQSVKFVNTL